MVTEAKVTEIVVYIGIVAFVLGLVVALVVYTIGPWSTEEELRERAAKKLAKRKRSIDVLNVRSKGDH